MDMQTTPDANGLSKPASSDRVFLVVIDDTPELDQALRFASRRAARTGGRVALLSVMEPSDFAHWTSVGSLMRTEQREEAEQLLQKMAGKAQKWCGKTPILFLREGKRMDQLLAVLNEEPQISVLVLGASTNTKGPGPLISALFGKMLGKVRVPITVVPGSLSEEQIDSLT